ncbi:hypothetical protein DLAC_03634 [Tieghemostelium lacteum]|uniref:Uncharacterized protein n=1 Tax=Tieghemostelium lacteum TaxID=361077 RepID=A0A152A0T6_TIELA|nr:hypothetical protein DLAC_03634 [Tieghemostelium lacteum]|eukprot:KYQ99694.1 hypothetical protein DLAC_03634 [Tieghemostelium lacteum]
MKFNSLLALIILGFSIASADYVNLIITPNCEENVSMVQGIPEGQCMGEYEVFCDYANSQVVFVQYSESECRKFIENKTIPFESCSVTSEEFFSYSCSQSPITQLPNGVASVTVTEFDSCSSKAEMIQYNTYPVDQCSGFEGTYFNFTCNATSVTEVSYSYNNPTGSTSSSASSTGSSFTGSVSGTGATSGLTGSWGDVEIKQIKPEQFSSGISSSTSQSGYSMSGESGSSFSGSSMSGSSGNTLSCNAFSYHSTKVYPTNTCIKKAIGVALSFSCNH